MIFRISESISQAGTTSVMDVDAHPLQRTVENSEIKTGKDTALAS
jgi:hypothetical protein